MLLPQWVNEYQVQSISRHGAQSEAGRRSHSMIEGEFFPDSKAWSGSDRRYGSSSASTSRLSISSSRSGSGYRFRRGLWSL